MNFVEISDYCSDLTMGNIDGYVQCEKALSSCKGNANCERQAKNYAMAVQSGGFVGTFGQYKEKYGLFQEIGEITITTTKPDEPDEPEDKPKHKKNIKLIVALVGLSVLIVGAVLIWRSVAKKK